jgi:hypothetical protein
MGVEKKIKDIMLYVKSDYIGALFLVIVFLTVFLLNFNYNKKLIQQNSLILSKMEDYHSIYELKKEISSIELAKVKQDNKEMSDNYSNLRGAVVKINSIVHVDRERIMFLYKHLNLKIENAYREEDALVDIIDVKEEEDTSEPKEKEVVNIESKEKKSKWFTKILPWKWF